jgi:hypothetical protein
MSVQLIVRHNKTYLPHKYHCAIFSFSYMCWDKINEDFGYIPSVDMDCNDHGIGMQE